MGKRTASYAESHKEFERDEVSDEEEEDEEEVAEHQEEEEEEENQDEQQGSNSYVKVDQVSSEDESPLKDGGVSSECDADQKDHSSKDSDFQRSVEKDLLVSKAIFSQRSAEVDSTNPSVADELIREGKNLKDTADRLKKAGSELEGTNTYLQAALRFVRGGLVLESCSPVESKALYMEAAELCNSAADEYGRQNERAASALAFRCISTAYWRTVYVDDARRQDYHDLENRLRNAHQDSNFHNQGTLAAVTPSLSHDSGSKEDHIGKSQDLLVISADDASRWERLTESAGFASKALEFDRKCKEAFKAAKENIDEKALPHVQRVMDLDFTRIEELIHLIQPAVQALKIDI